MSLELVRPSGTADRNLFEKWDKKLRACQQARMAFERQWFENMAFYFGRQWIIFTKNPTGGFQLSEQPSSDKWRVRHTANRILRIIRTEVTKLTKEEPQFYCVPKSTEEKDRLAAIAGDAIAEYVLRTKYFNLKRLEATFWASICGTSFLKNYYDENQEEIDGQPGKICFEAVPAFFIFVPNLYVIDIQDQPYVIHARTMDPETVYQSYGVDVKPGTDSSSTILDSRFMSALGIKQNTNDETKMCYVREHWVKPCREFPNGSMFVTAENQVIYVYEPQIDPAVSMDESMNLMQQMNPGPQVPPVGQSSSNPTPFGPSTNADTEGADRDISRNPNMGQNVLSMDKIGRNVLAPMSDMEGAVGYEHNYPYRHGRFPFVKIDHIPTGMFYAESVIKSLIPLQKEYNRTRSIMLENRNLAGKPQWGYITGSIDPKKFTSKPGLLLAVQLGFDFPKALDQPELPPSVTNELEVTVRDMDDVSSQYEITKGRTPPGVEAASAIAYLQEENDTVMYHTVQSLEAAVQETGIQVLANVHDFWSEDRIVQMTSKNQFLEVRQFKAADLNPIMDFRVEPGSMAPRSQAAKQAFITELMKMGAIDPVKGLKYLQMAETNKLFDELMLDSRHAQRENVIMSQGQELTKVDPKAQPVPDPMTGMIMGPAVRTDVQRDPMTGEALTDDNGQPLTYNVTTNPFDNHEAHIQEHQSYQKTQEYELLSPEIQQIIQDHVDQHKMEMLKERNALQTDQAMNQKAMGAEEQSKPPELPTGGTIPASGNGSGQPAEVTS